MDEQPNSPTFRWTPVLWVLAISAAGFMYHVLVFHRLEQTALLFVGIPVLPGSGARKHAQGKDHDWQRAESDNVGPAALSAAAGRGFYMLS